MQTPNAPLPMETQVHEVKQLIDNSSDFVLLDCREEAEFATARIEGAVLVPLSKLQEKAGELESYRDRHVVVHCHHGGRSMQMVQLLRANGYDQCQSMAGGIDAWSVEIDHNVPRY